MNGVARQGVAALDRAGTSTLTSWSPQTSLGAGQGGEVYSLAASASTMYLGGAFRTVNGVASPSLAAVSLETGASLPSWAPAADDAVSWIALAPQGLAVAGSFTALGHPPLGSGALVDEPATTHRGGFALLPALPDAPLAVSAAPAASSASVSFSAPAFDGGTPVTSYTVTASPGGATATGDESPVVVGGLTNGTAYTFTVTATTAAGVGAASSPSAAVIPRTVPGAPTHVTATATNGQALVTFTHPASDGGAPITSYTLTVSPGGETVSATDGPIWVTGLSNGTSYTFTVTATNSAGTGPAASPSEAVVPVGIGRSHPAPPPPAPRPAAPDVPITAGVRPPAPSESSVPG
jgi:hypothetical protein